MGAVIVGAIAPPPSPCTNRAITSTIIDGARPPAVRPMQNNASETTNGVAGPISSARLPATTIPMRLPSMKAAKTHP